GMSIDAIAALLGHKSLAMTVVYIADKTVAEEYFSVSSKVESLYGQPRSLPANHEGSEMRKLRAEMHRRMSATGTAHARSRWTATSSPSANHAPSSSPPSSSDPPCRPNA